MYTGNYNYLAKVDISLVHVVWGQAKAEAVDLSSSLRYTWSVIVLYIHCIICDYGPVRLNAHLYYTCRTGYALLYNKVLPL